MNKDHLIAHFPMNDPANAGKNVCENSVDATLMGQIKPEVKNVCGRNAVAFAGGMHGTSYMQLDSEIFRNISDAEGITVSAWVNPAKGSSIWERLIDFGKGESGPYIFLTRELRGVVLSGEELPAAGSNLPVQGEWNFVAFTISGTGNGTRSNAGPVVYLNGTLAANGEISQTNSGSYKVLREFFDAFSDTKNFSNSYIGHSQFAADDDFSGAISDLRIYDRALNEGEIVALMCESLTDAQILDIARDKFLIPPRDIITGKPELQESLMDGKVDVIWSCSEDGIISGDGWNVEKPVGAQFKARLSCGEESLEKTYNVTLMPADVAPYELTVHTDDKVMDISSTLYGLFFEDINHAADGGIYAEMIQNRSFEDFVFNTYDPSSGENGSSTGRKYDPLHFWFGDIDKVTVRDEGGLNEYFGLRDPETNIHYISVQKGTRLFNYGFCDNRQVPSMQIHEGEKYEFSFYARSLAGANIKVTLTDVDGRPVSNTITISVAGDTWNKYSSDELVGNTSTTGKIELNFDNEADVDMISLMPGNVWGASEEKLSVTAHKNYKNNSNYRLRRDLVEALKELHPTFMRFPGGCISEGSYIWENVYDWKESVGDVAIRKENYNVWGYVMTMGLGYMEYFQLSEDLGALPLPVMACGVLCQARSDYANPAGGALREKYISNFTDLMDFAISTDFEGNEWARLRRDMGHEEPFELHYLGVGNENWGSEFFANFEIFREAIDRHMEENYPGYDLTIVSTAGAQADDDAYQNGWKFLSGHLKGGEKVAFTDGTKSTEEDVTWYPYRKHHMDTIVDEHYYRANDYLLENADRYNYYERAYINGEAAKGNNFVSARGILDDSRTPKVFVGEYASNEKNTMAGAVAEAAVMTGFENNSDVVRLAATAPLFNKVGKDGTYRWTPDCIWFDDEKVWKTPTYYVQQLFAKYLGTEVVKTEFSTYEKGEKSFLSPAGGIIAAAKGNVLLEKLEVLSNDGNAIFTQDFTKELSVILKEMPANAEGNITASEDGLLLEGDSVMGFYIDKPSWKNYRVVLKARKLRKDAVIYSGAGLKLRDEEFSKSHLDAVIYCVGDEKCGNGLKVIKNGKEGYTMGDFSSSVYAGNLRACFDEELPLNKDITICLEYGSKEEDVLSVCADLEGKEFASLTCKLEAYNRDVFSSVTKDDKNLYLKLVNADGFEKNLTINLDNLSDGSAEVITIGGDFSKAAIPNVNTADNEEFVPVNSKTEIKEGKIVISLKPCSLTVIKAAL